METVGHDAVGDFFMIGWITACYYVEFAVPVGIVVAVPQLVPFVIHKSSNQEDLANIICFRVGMRCIRNFKIQSQGPGRLRGTVEHSISIG